MIQIDMEMPKGCKECPMNVEDATPEHDVVNYCALLNENIYCLDSNRQTKCPLKEVSTGKWISHKEHCEQNNLLPSGLGAYFWCSNCNCGIDTQYFHRNEYNYCPECGALMVEEQQGENTDGKC